MSHLCVIALCVIASEAMYRGNAYNLIILYMLSQAVVVAVAGGGIAALSFSAFFAASAPVFAASETSTFAFFFRFNNIAAILSAKSDNISAGFRGTHRQRRPT